jgi:hypothetical protein
LCPLSAPEIRLRPFRRAVCVPHPRSGGSAADRTSWIESSVSEPGRRQLPCSVRHHPVELLTMSQLVEGAPVVGGAEDQTAARPSRLDLAPSGALTGNAASRSGARAARGPRASTAKLCDNGTYDIRDESVHSPTEQTTRRPTRGDARSLVAAHLRAKTARPGTCRRTLRRRPARSVHAALGDTQRREPAPDHVQSHALEEVLPPVDHRLPDGRREVSGIGTYAPAGSASVVDGVRRCGRAATVVRSR